MNNVSNDGIGVLGALGVAFVVLKLMDVIDWSWWWVTLPFWGVFAVLILISAIYFIVYGICKYKSTNRNK